MGVAVLALLPSKAWPTPAADSFRRVRFGVLGFGTAGWEVDITRRQRLDREFGFAMDVVPFASGEAAKVALLAGAVDVIVADLVWVARRRAEGDALSIIPYSRALGTLDVPAGSPIRSLTDLAGKRLGVAGGALDKNWLLLRALAKRELDQDMRLLAEPVFGAAPLISNELQAGRLDAALTFWNFAARLEAEGARPLLTVSEMLARLGISPDVPLLGYAFRAEWAQANADLVGRFAACLGAAKAVLAQSDDAWRALGPRLGTDNPDIQTRLRDGYRAGIPGSWTARERGDAAKLFSILAELGGQHLVGQARSLDPAIFWTTAPP
ncbi:MULTISPECIES: transporter substrate-binding domain-containing protein [unclassified Chelatococcus]|uniref:ABC transporter substrate-binding protein n=1 Tax=unclassified Chelatococcus TaxID=2638111 RepID=UPI001BCB03E0|nr:MULTISPECIES: transporter substrate-binding domain-containing protein [unclassified Chelatococcus]MBS7700034.1 ABC transporter substrate-binding protein [Chelatococcus sp. YT9]MBX3556727.1 ABC transporter substrate-binding protein [Chelatococcus sp.]